MKKKYARFIDEFNIEYLDKPYVKYEVEKEVVDEEGNIQKVMQMTTFANPTEEQIKNAGYKEVVQDETIPEYDENTHYLEQRYIDGTVITIGNVAVEYVVPEGVEDIIEGEEI